MLFARVSLGRRGGGKAGRRGEQARPDVVSACPVFLLWLPVTLQIYRSSDKLGPANVSSEQGRTAPAKDREPDMEGQHGKE